MVVRHKRRKGRYLGSRHCGHGNIKNRRNKGSRGGVGYAGSHKHRWTYIVKYEPDHFSTKGFHSIRRKELPVVSVGFINGLAESGRLAKKDGKLGFEFSGKILGGGLISHAVSVKAACFSKSAEEKIRQAGGEALASGKAVENAA